MKKNFENCKKNAHRIATLWICQSIRTSKYPTKKYYLTLHLKELKKFFEVISLRDLNCLDDNCKRSNKQRLKFLFFIQSITNSYSLNNISHITRKISLQEIFHVNFQSIYFENSALLSLWSCCYNYVYHWKVVTEILSKLPIHQKEATKNLHFCYNKHFFHKRDLKIFIII